MKYAFITGASRGIGRAIAEQMVAAGYGVTFTYVSNDAAARELVAELQVAGGYVDFLKFDVSDPVATEKAIDDWEKVMFARSFWKKKFTLTITLRYL